MVDFYNFIYFLPLEPGVNFVLYTAVTEFVISLCVSTPSYLVKQKKQQHKNSHCFGASCSAVHSIKTVVHAFRKNSSNDLF